MKLLQTDFIKEFFVVVLGTLLFAANCAFVFIPSVLGSVPGQPLVRGIVPVFAETEAPREAPVGR